MRALAATPRAVGLQMKVREGEGAGTAATDRHCGAGQRLQAASWPAPLCGRPIAGHDAPLLGPLMPGPDFGTGRPHQLAATAQQLPQPPCRVLFVHCRSLLLHPKREHSRALYSLHSRPSSSSEYGATR